MPWYTSIKVSLHFLDDSFFFAVAWLLPIFPCLLIHLQVFYQVASNRLALLTFLVQLRESYNGPLLSLQEVKFIWYRDHYCTKRMMLLDSDLCHVKCSLNCVCVLFIHLNLPRNGVDQIYTNWSKDKHQNLPSIPHKEIKNKWTKED